jgi:NTE family protein
MFKFSHSFDPEQTAGRLRSTLPVRYKNVHLIEGGIISLVRVRFARAIGADFAIAVDIYCEGARADGLGALTVMQRRVNAQSCPVAEPEMAEAEVSGWIPLTSTSQPFGALPFTGPRAVRKSDRLEA